MTAPGPGRGGGSVRYCAVGWPVDPTAASTIRSYLDAVAEVLDRTVGGPQHLGAETAGAPPTLVAFPEHTGLTAMFVGSRGEEARGQLAAGAGTMEVFTALAIGYGEVLGHVASRFPGVTSAGRLLHLACTDVVVRTLVEGFAELAARRGVWLTVGAALPGWRSVPVETLDADVAALLLGPDHADAATVHVPTGAEVRNRNLVISPDEGLVAVHDKVALVPLEADADEGLGLSAAGLSEVEVVDLPVGRIGTVISKDAWMPDVNDRLDQLGAEILLQPEAFDRWALVDRQPPSDRGDEDASPADGGLVDLWPPDKFQRGGWWMVQRHPSFRANVTPMLVGHLGALSFDGQPLIAVPAPGGRRHLGLLGQPADEGWAAVGPWGGSDEHPEALADPARRATFEAGARRRTSGDRPTQTGGASIVCAEVHLPPRPATNVSVHWMSAPRRSREVTQGLPEAGGPAGRDTVQLVPDLSAAGQEVWLAWIEADADGRQALTVASGDGERWTVITPPRAAWVAARRWRPRIVASDDRVLCLHLGVPRDSWDLLLIAASRAHLARNDAAGSVGWTDPVRVDDAHDHTGVLRERLHDAPVLTRVGGQLLAVWSDLRWPWVFPQVRAAWSDDDGTTWSPSFRVDGGPLHGQPDPLQPRSPHETLGQTCPAVTVTGEAVLVVWQERGSVGAPTLRLARLEGDRRSSHPFPRRAPEPPRTGDDGDDAGRVARPAIVAVGDTVWLVRERWLTSGGAMLEVACSGDGGRTWRPWEVVDASRPTGVTQRYATLVPVDREYAHLVFEDDRGGTSQVVAVTLGAEGAVTAPVRLDDTPSGAHARVPTAARAGDHLVVVWQDTRGATERLRSVRLPLDRRDASR